MLVISRKAGEKLFVGGIEIQYLGQRCGQARIGIVAPRDVPIEREEVRTAKIERARQAMQDGNISEVRDQLDAEN